MDLGVKEKANIDIHATADVLEFEAIPTILRPKDGQSIDFKAIVLDLSRPYDKNWFWA